jgi:hypothetical protein
MQKIWKWVKEHWQILLGALGAIIAGLLAWGAYERKIGRLKDAVEVEKTVSEVKRLEAKNTVLQKQEDKAGKKDLQLEKKIQTAKKKVVEVRENVDARTDQEIADRFNQLYR